MEPDCHCAGERKESSLHWKTKLLAHMHQTRIKARARGYSRSKYACPDSHRRPNSFKQKHNLTYEVINAMIMGREDTTVQTAARLLSINRKLYYPFPQHTYLSQFLKWCWLQNFFVCIEGIADCFSKISMQVFQVVWYFFQIMEKKRKKKLASSLALPHKSLLPDFLRKIDWPVWYSRLQILWISQFIYTCIENVIKQLNEGKPTGDFQICRC